MMHAAPHVHAGLLLVARLAQRADDLFYIADLGDFEAEILADLDGIAKADGFVVDH